jgi:hypothetical protein
MIPKKLSIGLYLSQANTGQSQINGKPAARSEGPTRCSNRQDPVPRVRSWPSRPPLRHARSTALAQAWPSKPIRLVVPFPPGGGTDIIAREVSQKVAAATGWTFVIDNKPGAGGNLGVDAAAKSLPDGYTLVLGQTSNLAINPTLYAKMPYDSQKDLAPIVLVANAPLVMVTGVGYALQDAGRCGERGQGQARCTSTSPRPAMARWPT